MAKPFSEKICIVLVQEKAGMTKGTDSSVVGNASPVGGYCWQRGYSPPIEAACAQIDQSAVMKQTAWWCPFVFGISESQ